MNERRVRRIIREALLAEAARGVSDLPDGVYISVMDYGDAVEFQYANEKGQRIMDPVSGFLAITYTDENDCDAWTIESSEADRGWGPLLYDIAMEWATQQGEGLMADRGTVSPSARRVWHHYFYRREGDIDAKFMGGEECEPDTRSQSAGTELDPQDDPLFYRYTKRPTTLNALKSAGRLVRLS